MQLQKRSADLKAAGIKVIAISVDSPAQNRKLATKLKLTSVKLYSDTHAKGAASKAFGYWNAKGQISKLGVVIIKAGKVVHRASGEQKVDALLKASR